MREDIEEEERGGREEKRECRVETKTKTKE